jgi:hypothetical protein
MRRLQSVDIEAHDTHAVVKSTTRLTNLVRCLLCGTVLNTLAGGLFFGGCVFVTIYVVSSVQIEVQSIQTILHNGILTSDAIARASANVEGAVAEAAHALNETSRVMGGLAAYLSAPKISIGLGDIGR